MTTNTKDNTNLDAKKVRPTVMTLNKRVARLEHLRETDIALRNALHDTDMYMMSRIRKALDAQAAASIAAVLLSAIAFIISVVTLVSTL